MSNSSLVTYTKISPNKNHPRNHVIDTITIHCIVGQWTAKQGCDYFASTKRECSANYVVGKDGSIGLCVDEGDRSWCSSSSSNDNRAITIETASDTKAPYAVTDAAYQALIKLVADICKRNGIKKLLWKGDKSLIGQVNKQNMTVHRWFANKACPGEYLYSRHGDIANKVNAILGTGTQNTSSDSDMSDEKMFKFFKEQGMTDAGVAGLMGNLYAESGLQSTNLQNSYNTKLGMTDDQYTTSVDNGDYINFVHDSAGYGLAQWTYWSRKEGLKNFMDAAGVSIGNKKKQCEYLIQELKSYKSCFATLCSTSSVKEASDAVLTQFEKPADQSDAVKTKRASYGQTYFNKYASTSTNKFPSVPFTVKVIIDDLNIRKSPGMNGTVVGQTGKGIFTITEVSNGWGKLKSGAGWIYLENSSYCTVQEARKSSLKSVEEVAKEVIQGKWGNGTARKNALEKACYDYATIQKKVNELL